MTQAKPQTAPPKKAVPVRRVRAKPVNPDPVRRVEQGDTAPSTRPHALEAFVTDRAERAAQDKAVAAALEP